MCGIAGLLTFDRDAGRRAPAALGAMLRAIEHRGPDGQGQWRADTHTGGEVAFGHARLAILDLTDAGRQPMTRGALTATFNGEIYNFRSLRDQLQRDGASFSTQSDTEVLLAAFDRWGDAALDRFDGMFAFAVWDAGRQELRLCRDRLGVKPLYVHHGPRHLLFASGIRALLASGLCSRTLDAQSLWHYLGYQTAPTPATLVRDVRMLEPGTEMRVAADGTIRCRQYWSLMDGAADRSARAPAGIEAAGVEVGARLEDAVRSHLVSDVPVGVFLSGGIDSGAIVSVLRSLGVRPNTFTVGLPGHDVDESAEARLLARHFDTDHVEVHLDEAEVLGMLPSILDATDHPSGDGVNTYVVSRAVRQQGVKVALSGLGGDELFGGYASFERLSRALPAARQVCRTPASIRRAAAGVIRAAGGGRVATTRAAAVLEGDGSLESMWPLTRQVFSERMRRQVLSSSLLSSIAYDDAYSPLLAAAYRSAPRAPLWSRMAFAEARTYMHDVLLRDTDQMSMAHALEVRVPLLDHHLASYVMSLPDALKREAGRVKPLLVRSLARPLPAELVGRPKRGFTLPFDAWMRGALRPFCEANLGPNGLDGRGLFQPGAIAGLWSAFLQRSPGITWSRIWILVALNAWLDRQAVTHATP